MVGWLVGKWMVCWLVGLFVCYKLQIICTVQYSNKESKIR